MIGALRRWAPFWPLARPQNIPVPRPLSRPPPILPHQYAQKMKSNLFSRLARAASSLLIACGAAVVPAASAQTTLSAGDVAIIGYNASGSPDTIALLILKNLSAGTTFHVNDNEVSTVGGTAFADVSEAEATFTVQSGQTVPAGTVVILPWGNQTVTSSVYTWTGHTGGGLGASGGTLLDDGLYIYTGATAAGLTPTAFIFYAKGTSTSANNGGNIPSGLSSGSTAITPSANAARYKISGATYSGSQSALLSAIGNTASNWESGAPGAASDWSFSLASGSIASSPSAAAAFTTAYGTASAEQTFAITASGLTANVTATAPTGFEISSDGTTYASTASFTQSGGAVSGSLRVRLAATAPVSGSYNSQNIALSSTGVTTVNVTTPASGNSVSAAPLTITGLNGANKVYDGTTAGTFTGTAAYSGLVNGETFSVTGTPSASFASASAGTSKTINVTGYTAPSTNYSVNQPTLTADITPATLTITANNLTKIYGAALSTVTGSTAFTSNGLVNGETIGSVTITYGSGAVDTDPAGAYPGSVVPSAATGGTFQAASYDIAYVAGNLTVSGSPTINATGSVGALSTTYGTASAPASFTVSGGNLTGNLSVAAPAGFEVSTAAGSGYGASLTLTATAGAVANTPVYVRLAAATGAGTSSGNVTVSGGGATSETVAIPASTVAPKALTITGLSGVSREYDGSNVATLSGTPAYNGLENGETFSVSGTASATFADKTVGTAKAITVTGYTDPSANYTVSQPTGLSADVTAKALTVADAAVTTKPYDTNANATITGTITGVIAPDVVTFNGTGTFAQVTPGTGIAVTSTSTLGGADAANYSFTQLTGLTGEITKANQTITFAALASKRTSDAPFALTGTASSSLAVSYASSNTGVATVSGNTVTIVGAGTTDLTASQAGNEFYNAAPDVVRTLTVTTAPAALGAGDIAIIGYNTSGTPDSFAILVLKELSGGHVFYVNDNEIASAGGTTFTDLGEGEASFTVKSGQTIAAGTVIILPWGGAAVSTTTYDWSSTSGFGLGNNNEELYIYTASALTATTPTAFLYFAKIGTSSSSNPAGLTAGTTFISPTGTASRYKTTGATYSGTPVTLLSAIGNTAANWEAVAPAAATDWSFTVATGATLVINDVTQAEGDSGSTTFQFTVTRSSNTSAVAVDYATVDGTATTAGNDYASASGTLSFTAGGALTASVSVTVNGDMTFESNETFTVSLSNATGAFIQDSSGTGTIQNDDATAPSITTQPASTSVASGSTATLTVAASGQPAPTFQWYLGNSGDTSSPVSGATSSSFTTPTLTANASYWVRATNAVSSVDSNTATITVTAAITSVNLANYVRVGRYGLPEPSRTALPAGTPTSNLLCQEASAVTYNWDTDTLFVTGDGGRSITQVSKTGALIDTMTLALGSSPQGTDFYDPEGLTYIGNGQFVMSEERDRQLVRFTYTAGTTLSRSGAKTVKIGTFVDNTGTEGLTYDPQTGGFICLKEISPIGIFQTNVDFDAGTATNGSASTVSSTDLFDPALLGMTDVADVFAFSLLPSFSGQTQAGNLLVLSQEDGRIVNVDRSGNIVGTLTISAGAGSTLNVAGQQHEGLTMDRSGNLYVVNENGGGGIDYPELWVYAPSTATNAAATAVAVNGAVTSILENVSTVSRVALGDIAVTDDGLGSNVLSLSGTDAASFEIVGTALYLKAGVALDYETKTSYTVTINADDTTVGSTPDATVSFTLAVTDVVAESAPAPAIIITEVAPWSSGNSPVIAADWFEVTNTTSSAINITGWKVDDNSNSFASAISLNGITSIAPGESVIFLESSATNIASTVVANFKSVWFGNNVPSGLQVGTYQGSGIGLGTSGDAVNLYDANGVLQANVTFGASPTASPYATFDNTAGVNNGAVTQLSVSGARGAFFAPSGNEIGSPGIAQSGLLVVSEVAPWSSGNSPVGDDWFEVTNVGPRVVSIAGWKVDDSSESPAAAVSLSGINSIAPGESVIFIETATPATKIATFRSNWNVSAGLQIGSYSGSGIGLSTGGDAVNLYDTANTRRANIAFGGSPTAAPYATFENAAALTVGTVTRLSVTGVNGAFTAPSGNEIGSPGVINRTPFVALTAANQAGTVSGSFTYTLAAGLFADPENGSLSFTATLADGSSLPAWLTFNPATLTFSGTPTAVDLGRVVIRVTASDNGTPALTTSTTFSINVAPASGSAFFPQSVASGDPRETSVVLWTRLLDGDTAVDRSVSLHLSTTGTLAEVGASTALGGTNLWTGGSLTAQSAYDGVVKVKATGLTADTVYYYQFTYNGNRSPIGRTRTAPAAGSTRAVKYAAVNCNDFVGRYFNVLKHLADQEANNIDFVLNLGDYIYETTGDPSFQTTLPERAMVLSKPSEAIDLGSGNYAAQSISNYRDIYKTIRQDRQLQRVHELFPMISIWDDHEFSDDNWKDNATYFDGKVNEQQTTRKRNGEQAWMEFLPTERGLAASGTGLDITSAVLYPNTTIYDTFNFGGALDLITTDSRTGRADHLVPEDSFPAAVPMDESATIATLAASYGLDVSTFTAAAWPGIKANFAPYVNIDDSAYAAVKAGLQAIVGAGASAELATVPAGQTAITTGSAYATAKVTGNLDASFINSTFAAAGQSQPFDATALAAMPRGLSFFLLGKTGFFSDFGSRYQVVNQTFQLYAGYMYQAFLASSGALGRDQAFFSSAQQTYLGTALGTSAAAGRTWRVVASSTPYTPIKLELGDLPSGVSLPTQGTISGVTIPASIPAQFLVEFLLNADEPAGFPQYRQGIIDLLAQYDALLISGDIHAQLVGNNLAANGQKVVDFTVPSAASGQFRRAVDGAFASVEALMTPSVRAATGLTGNFTFDATQKQAVIDATDEIIKKNTAEMFDADTATHGYTVFTADAAGFTANFRKIDVSYIDDNLYSQSTAALDSLFQREELTVTKTGTGANTDLLLGAPTTVTTTVAGSTGGTVTGGGSLVTGTSATFTATPAAGYRLSGWKVNGTAAGSTNPLVTTVTAGMTVEATFTYQVQILHYYGESGLLGVTTAPIMGAMIDRFDDQYSNTLVLAEGDSFIPGPWLVAGADPSFNRILHTGTFTSSADTTATPMGRADFAIMNAFGTIASSLGNHEFDLGSPVLSGSFFPANSSTVGNWAGAQFPFITANLDFSADSSLRGRADTSLGGTGGAVAGSEVSALKGRIAPYAIRTINGQKIGFVGATTWELLSKSSPNGTVPKDDNNAATSDLQEVAAYLQSAVNALQALGVNKIIQLDQLDTLQRNKDLAGLVSGIDVVVAGGGHEYQKDANDVAGSYAAHTTPAADAYPIQTTGADGKPVLIVTTDTEFSYLGRLVVDFDANGELVLSGLDSVINGAYSADEETLRSVYGSTSSADTIVAASTIGSTVKTITTAINGVISSKEGTIYGYTNVYLEGDRVFGRTQEVNLGNITADANAVAARTALGLTSADAVFSLKNGGGIRASIGAIAADGSKVAPTEIPGIKPAGAISLLDVENALRFDNKIMAFDTTPQGLLAILNFAAGLSSGPTAQNGGYPQVGNIRFSYDPSRAAGQKVRNVALYNEAGSLVSLIVQDGSVVAGAPSTIRCVSLNFTANGGDSYPIKANADNFRYVLTDGTLSAAVSEVLDFTAAANVPSNAMGEQKAFQNFLAARHASVATAYNSAETPASQDQRIQILSSTFGRTSDTVITPSYSFAASTYEASQTDASVTVSIQRSFGANAGSVTIRTDDGTASTVPPFTAAVAGTDYTDADGTVVSFAAGETSKTVSITLVPKTATTTPNRRFSVALTASSDGVLGATATAEVQIQANDTVKPTLAITAPATAGATVSDASPYTLRGTAGDARGLDRVTVALNGGAAVEATLGSATVPTSVPWTLNITPVAGSNTVDVTAYDLKGNATTLSRTFTFTERFTVTLARTAPAAIALDTAGTVALVATPATNATALAPATANADPRTANIVPGTTVTLTATAKVGYAFTSWSGLPAGATALGSVATFTMPSADVSISAAFQANSVFSGSTGSAGNFYGLLQPNTGTSTSNATVGFLSGTLTTTGAFSGRLLVDGLAHAFAASFFGDGSVVFTVAGVRQDSITLGGRTLTLSYNAGAGNDAVTATLTSGSNVSSGVARRAIYSATNTVPAALLNTVAVANGPIVRGSFTMVLPAKAQVPALDLSTYPQGDGWATLTLSNTGLLTGTLWTADGSIFTLSSALVSGNQCPVFAQLTTPGQLATVRGGSFLGTLVFDTTQADTDVAGSDLTWIRPDVTSLTPGTTPAAIAAANLYTAGWPSGIKVDAIGALYDKSKTVQAGVDLDGPSTDVNGATLGYEDGKLDFSGGKLTLGITKQNFIVAGNTVTKIPATDTTFTLTAASASGILRGTFRPNWTSLASVNPGFSGVLLQKGIHKGGHGFFISNAMGDTDPESGDVDFTLEPLTGATAPLAATTPATVSATSPYTLSGTAGNSRGVARVEVVLNGAAPVNATLGTAAATGSVPYSLALEPVLGTNTVVITVVDLRGNRTSTTVTFTFNQRFQVAINRTVPSGVNMDDAGTVTLAALPATQATALTPATANANPRTANVQHGTALTLTATPKTGYAFVRWTGLPMTATVTGNVASFSMPTTSLNVTAEFATSSSVFAGAAGTGTGFFGLIRPETGTATSNATVGFLTGSLTATTGLFTGSILVDGVTQAISATFYGDGSPIFTVSGTKQKSLSFGGRTLTLSLNTGGGNDEITATLTSGGNTSSGVAKRAIYTATNPVAAGLLNATATTGLATVVFPFKAQTPAVDATTYPQGDGYASIAITNAGAMTITGTLADNTTFSATTALVEGNEVPFFGQILTPGSTTVRGGSFSGTLKLDTVPADSDLTGTDLLWIRSTVTQQSGTTAAVLATQIYTAGWPNGILVDALGALYNRTLTVQTSLGLGALDAVNGNGKLQFADGKLTTGITKTNFNVNGSTVTKIPASDTSFTLTVTQTTGAFSGTIRPNWTPTATALPAFKGIILQKGANQGGFGFFLSNIPSDSDPESGGVSLGKP